MHNLCQIRNHLTQYNTLITRNTPLKQKKRLSTKVKRNHKTPKKPGVVNYDTRPFGDASHLHLKRLHNFGLHALKDLYIIWFFNLLTMRLSD